MLVAVTFVNLIFRNFAWIDDVKSLFLYYGDKLKWLGPSWMGVTHGNVIFDILKPQLFKNIAYVGSLNHFSFQSFFTCNLHFDQEQHYQQCQAVIVPKHFHTLHEWNLDVYPPFNWIGPVTQEEIWAIANSCNSPFQTLNVWTCFDMTRTTNVQIHVNMNSVWTKCCNSKIIDNSNH